MNALVIGYGSIGQRHCRILSDLGCSVSIVSRHEECSVSMVDRHGGCNVPMVSRHEECRLPVYRTLYEAMQNQSQDYVHAVIANRTDQHHETLCALRELGYQGTVLVEKPLFDHLPLLLPPSVENQQKNVFAAYNLRFHPVLQRLKLLLNQQKLISVQVYAGQYLPHWRTGDYRKRYSAKRSKGGGVLRDLSHELDYVQWLFGAWERVVALGGRHSCLEIDSEDVFSLLLSTKQCPIINIQINYLDHIHQRNLIINTNSHTYAADLVHHTLQINERLEAFPCPADTTYRAQHQALLQGQYEHLCSFEEALETVHLIQKAEQSAVQGRWMVH